MYICVSTTISTSGNHHLLRELSLAQTGVRIMPGTAGCIIDPPAASEYAVLPVGVAMIRPSPCTMVTCLSFTLGHQHSHSQNTDMIQYTAQVSRVDSFSCSATEKC